MGLLSNQTENEWCYEKEKNKLQINNSLIWQGKGKGIKFIIDLR